VVVVGVEQGIILAMALSIVEHIFHSYRPYDTLIGQTAGGDLESFPPSSGTQIVPGVAVYRVGASLYYANATRFTAEIMDLVEDADPPLEWLVLLASAIGDVDYSGSDSIRQVHEELGGKDVTLSSPMSTRRCAGSSMTTA
jgi:MFS superfamily sulfate permease-like transporter